MMEPDLSTLPQRMRYAAEVLESASQRLTAEYPDRLGYWYPNDLRIKAHDWEAKDRAAAERDTEVEELAKLLYTSIYNGPPGDTPPWNSRSNMTKSAYQRQARKLIDAGWRKTEETK